MKTIIRFKNHITTVGLILLSSFALAQEFNIQDLEYEIFAEFFPEDANYLHYEAPSEAYIRAHTKINFDDIQDSELIFYLHGEFWIDSIVYNNTKVDYKSEKVFYSYEYSRVALKIDIDLSRMKKPYDFDIYYYGYLNPSKAASISNFMKADSKDGVLLRGYGYSLWFPVFINSNEDSYKANFKNVIIKTPGNFRTVVAGKLMNEYQENSKTISIWQPGMIDIFDVQCISRDYQITSKDNVYVYYLKNERSEKSSQRILDFVIELKTLFKDNLRNIGKSDPIYIVEMPKYGDISGNNIVGVQEASFQDFNNIRTKLTIAHELVHPYVHIPVNRDNPFYTFVIEGIPSFFQSYAVAELLDEDDYNLENHLKQLEKAYLQKRETGLNRRGRKLPEEKPILEITANEIGMYKDKFVLSDRVWLFFYHIWNKMGDEQFDRFINELFNRESINYESFENLVIKYLADFKEDLHIWLSTTEFPDRFKINN